MELNSVLQPFFFITNKNLLKETQTGAKLERVIMNKSSEKLADKTWEKFYASYKPSHLVMLLHL